MIASPLVRASIRFTVALVLALSLGWHWALLQTVAWTGMLIRYSRDGSIREAVARTFDGQHPCALCKVIKQGRAEEKQQKQNQVKPGSKLDWGLVWQAPAFHFGAERAPVAPFVPSATSRSDEPPKPRPRTVHGDSRALA